MRKHLVLYSADYDFQVLGIYRGEASVAWGAANLMYEDGTFRENGIEHYDVMPFDTQEDMNEWILEQVGETRPAGGRR